MTKVKFRPRARLLHIIGGDLIKDEMAGVIELIKNAYDADAEWVNIIFKNLDKYQEEYSDNDSGESPDIESPTLIIEDNGHGMSHASIESGWLSPATGMKEREEESPRGRPMLGRKGVGRFSAMRLGEKLFLTTIPGEEEPELEREELGNKYRIELEWSDFQKPEVYLDQVEVDLEVFEDADPKCHGVRLEILRLRDEWDKRRIKRLIRELRLLLSPLPLKDEEMDFKIHLDIESSGLKDEEILKAAGKIELYAIPQVTDYTAIATIEESGEYDFLYERELRRDVDSIEQDERESGEDIRLLFPEYYRETFPPTGPEDESKLPCGPLEIRFEIWDRDIDLLLSKAKRLKDVEELGVRAIRRLLDDFSGISIYRDGFRVRPYGDEEKDWLGLGQRRVQRGARIGPNQLFGIVYVSSARNPLLEDKASREGLKENEAYNALQACVLAFLGWVENYRFRFRKRQGLGRPDPKSTRALTQERESAFGRLRQSISDVVIDEKIKKEVVKLIDQAERAAEKEKDSFTEQTEILHDSHTLGLLARFVVHEGRNLNGTLNSGLRNINRVAQKGKEKDPERVIIKGKSLDIFDSNLGSARRSVERLDTVLDQLDPLTRPRHSRRPHKSIEEVLNRVTAILEPDLQEYGIDFKVQGGNIKVVAWEADIFHAFYNLLHNSIYWVQRNPPGDRDIGVRVRTRPKAESEGESEVVVVVSDNGPGVSTEAAPWIFDLGYTEKPDGYGVGLFIAREAIERSGGAIELLNPGERGAQFQIVLKGV